MTESAPVQDEVKDSQVDSTDQGESEIENLASDPNLAQECLDFVNSLHTSLKRKRKPFEPVWAECQEAFRTVERKTWFQGSNPYCSPQLRDAVLTIVPRISKAVWYSDTPFDLVPIGDEGEDDKLAEINQKVLEWDFRNLKIYLKYVDAIMQKTIFGTTIVKTPPHFENVTKELRNWVAPSKVYGIPTGKKKLSREKKSERMFMGTDMSVVDLFDFWIDPTTVQHGIGDQVEYGDCIEQIIVKKSHLKAGEELGIYTNLDKCENDYIGAKMAKSDDTSYKQRVKNAANLQSATVDGGNVNKSALDKGNRMYAIKECYCDFDLGEKNGGLQRVLITTVADRTVIRIQKWTKDKPYLTSRYIPNGYNKEFYGTGIIEPNLSQHYEINATNKQLIAARTLGLNQEFISDQTGFINKPDKLRTSPNKIHYVQNINGVKPFEKPIAYILQTSEAYLNQRKSEIQQSTGATPYISGTDPSKINDTASGISMLTQAGTEKFSFPLQVDETGFLEPFVKRSLQNRVSYTQESFYLRLTDKKPVRVNPEDLSANYDVYSKGYVELQNKQMREKGIANLVEAELKLMPIEMQMYGRPLAKLEKLHEELYLNAGISQPKNFLYDPKELQGQQMRILTPDMEKVLLQRMASKMMPLNPILIQPGEDYVKHYEEHLAYTNTEEFKTLPPQVQTIWFAHIAAYDKVLNLLEERKKDANREENVEKQEVAVSE